MKKRGLKRPVGWWPYSSNDCNLSGDFGGHLTWKDSPSKPWMPCPRSHICHWVVSWDITVPKEIFCQSGTMGHGARWNVLTLSRKFCSGFKVNPTSEVKNGDMCFARRKLEDKQDYIMACVCYTTESQGEISVARIQSVIEEGEQWQRVETESMQEVSVRHKKAFWHPELFTHVMCFWGRVRG